MINLFLQLKLEKYMSMNNISILVDKEEIWFMLWIHVLSHKTNTHNFCFFYCKQKPPYFYFK